MNHTNVIVKYASQNQQCQPHYVYCYPRRPKKKLIYENGMWTNAKSGLCYIFPREPCTVPRWTLKREPAGQHGINSQHGKMVVKRIESSTYSMSLHMLLCLDLVQGNFSSETFSEMFPGFHVTLVFFAANRYCQLLLTRYTHFFCFVFSGKLHHVYASILN